MKKEGIIDVINEVQKLQNDLRSMLKNNNATRSGINRAKRKLTKILNKLEMGIDLDKLLEEPTF